MLWLLQNNLCNAACEQEIYGHKEMNFSSNKSDLPAQQNSLVSRGVPANHQVFGLVVAHVQVAIVFRDQVHIMEDETVPIVVFQGL